MAVTELKGQEWQEFSQADYAVIDCFGDNCTACVMLAPVFDAVANEMTGIAFGRINISVFPEIANLYSVNAMPTLLFFRKGKNVHQAIGSMGREKLLEHIAKLLYE